MMKKVIFVISVASLCLLSIMLNIANPTQVGPFGILIFFGLFYTSLLGVVTYFLFTFGRAYALVFKHIATRKPITSISFKLSLYYSSVVSAGVVIILGLQTVAALGLYQLLLVALLVFVGCLYISKRIS